MNSICAKSSETPSLQNLLHRQLVWRGNVGLAQATRSTGQPLLDEKLGGGFPASGLIDIHSPRGIGELRLLLPALARPETDRLAEQNARLCVFINPPAELHAEGLAGAGVELARVLRVRPHTVAEALWAAEQSLKSGACHTVLLWQQTMTIHQARRLQLTAKEGRAQLLLLRDTGLMHETGASSLPASLSLRLAAHARGLSISIPKRRGGWSVPEFVLDMQTLWPELTLAPAPEGVVPLAGAQAV